MSPIYAITEKLRSFLLRKPEDYIFYSAFIINILIFFLVPGNKFLVAAIFGLTALHIILFKNIRLGLMLGLATSSFFSVGKTYETELIPRDLIQSEYFPNGLMVQTVITATHILEFLTLLYLVYDTVRNKTLRLTLPVVLTSVISVITLLSALIASRRPDISVVIAVKSFETPVFAFLMFQIAATVKNARKYVLSFLLSAVLFQSLIMGVQFFKHSFIGSNVENSSYVSAGSSVDEDIFDFRPLGTFTHPNEAAQYLVFVLPFFLACLYSGSREYRMRLFVAVAAGTGALIATQSRSAWISFGLAVTGLVYVVEKRWRLHIHVPHFSRRTIIAAAVAGGGICLYVLSKRISQSTYSFEDQASFSTRIELVKEWLSLILLHPLLGVGPGMSVMEVFYQSTSFIIKSFPENVHNTYLLMASETGLAGLVSYAVLVVYMLKRTLAAAVSGQGAVRLASVGILAGFSGMLINMLFQPYQQLGIIILVTSVYCLYNSDYDQATH